MLNIRSLTVNPLQERCYVAWREAGRCILVDPGCCDVAECDALADLLAQERLSPEAILLTHGHFDHVLGVQALQECYGIPVRMHPADGDILARGAQMAVRFGLPAPQTDFRRTEVADGETLTVAGMRIEVIATPGHSPGSVCYLEREAGILFSGDTLFAGAIGRTDLPGGEYDDEIRSIMEKLILLDPETRILPGHGPSSTIGHERTHNPFLEPFNEPEEAEDREAAPVVIRRDA